MKVWAVFCVILISFMTCCAANGATVMNFTSGTVISGGPWYGFGGPNAYYPFGASQYIESGVTVDAVYGGFFLDNGGLNLAMESGPVKFSMGGAPFDFVSIDAFWLGSGDPNISPYTFTSSKGGTVTVSENGTYTFPNTSQWKSVTYIQWTPNIFGLIDNVTINPIPEPSNMALLLSSLIPIYFVFKNRSKAD